MYKFYQKFVKKLSVIIFIFFQCLELNQASANELKTPVPITSSDKKVFQDSQSNLPSCHESFSNFVYISALKLKLEKSLEDETVFPQIIPMYEIIWHEPGKIKAIIELDHHKEWNGSIHSWYETGAYLGCAGLENGEHKGISIAYHENGNIRAIANFKAGVPVGLEYQFDRLGQLNSTKSHDKNSISSGPMPEFKH